MMMDNDDHRGRGSSVVEEEWQDNYEESDDDNDDSIESEIEEEIMDDDDDEWSKSSSSVRSYSSSNGSSSNSSETDDENNTTTTRTLANISLALLGDSEYALFCSFAILLLSIVLAWHMNSTQQHDQGDNSLDSSDAILFPTYESLGPIPDIMNPTKFYHMDYNRQGDDDETTQPHIVITEEMREEYERDGAICVRGLVSDELLQHLDEETSGFVEKQRSKEDGRGGGGQRRNIMGRQFYNVEHSVLLSPPLIRSGDDEGTTEFRQRRPTALQELALWSAIPQMAAALLNLTTTSDNAVHNNNKNRQNAKDGSPTTNNSSNTEETLRVIRDIFLSKDDEDKYVCGWHVDDLGFWPATPESMDGVNAWIALDDMELTDITGGFALAIQSHTAPWKSDAYYWTGAPSSNNFPFKMGYKNVSDLFKQRTGYGTCHLEQAAPHIHRRMEETARIYPVRRGDVIFHTRWLFHRTVAASVDPRQGQKQVYRRYSIRYGLGSQTIIPPGYGMELSVLYDESNGGRTADDVQSHDGPWYPQAWPPIRMDNNDEGGELEKFWSEMEVLVRDKVPVAVERREQRKQEMKPFLKRLAKEQHHRRLSTQGQG